MAQKQVVHDNSYQSYDAEDVATFLNWDEFEKGGLKMYKAPRVVWRITISGFTERISISRHKDIPEKDVEHPEDDLVIGLWEHYKKDNKCNYLYLDANGIPIFFGDKQSLICVEEHLFDTLPEFSLEQAREYVKNLEKSSKEVFFINARDCVSYCRKSTIGKLFYPFLKDWIDKSYPELLTGGDAAQLMTEEGLRILLIYFIGMSTGHFVPLASCPIPEKYQFIVSLDGYLDSVFGAPGLPTELTKDIKKMMPAPKALTSNVSLKSSSIEIPVDGKVVTPTRLSDSALMEIVKNRMSNDVKPFYDSSILTRTDIKDPISEFVSVSWLTFVTCLEQFKTGASVFFAPNEVVLDDAGHILFSENNFPLLHYHGPEFELEYKRNTVDVLYKGDSIDVLTLANLREYLYRMFNIKIQGVESSSEILGKSK